MFAGDHFKVTREKVLAAQMANISPTLVLKFKLCVD